MNKETFIKEVEKLGLELNEDILDKLSIYMRFLIEYNEHTNLTAIKDEKSIYLKHFYDSLTILKAVNLNTVDNLLDVGTGAGFPGMVLKIVYPELNVTLLDSNNKKCKFLSELKEKLNIEVTIINDRVEMFAKDNLNKFDIVTSRAVANLRVLSELCLPLVKINGLFIPLKGKLEEELTEAIHTIELMGGKINNTIEFELYKNNGTRNILVIEKLKETRSSNLRGYDKIIKNPLKK